MIVAHVMERLEPQKPPASPDMQSHEVSSATPSAAEGYLLDDGGGGEERWQTSCMFGAYQEAFVLFVFCLPFVLDSLRDPLLESPSWFSFRLCVSVMSWPLCLALVVGES